MARTKDDLENELNELLKVADGTHEAAVDYEIRLIRRQLDSIPDIAYAEQANH